MIILALVIFGILYALGVAALRAIWPDHHWTSILVVFGVFGVVVGFGIWHGQKEAVDLFTCFVAAGLPMILGDLGMSAYLERKAAQRNAAAIREDMNRVNPS